MNVGRLIGGIVCLALGVLLMVLYYTLPEGKVVFKIGDANVPYVPAAVLAGVGIWLIGTSRKR